MKESDGDTTMPVTENANTGRRNFLTHILTGWILAVLAPLFYVIIRYIIPPKLREKILEVLNVAKISDVPVNAAKIVRFNKIPIVLVHTSANQIKAYSAVCTHLGCIVQYQDEDKNFHCNCHGSVFNLDGKNIAGPAPRPLKPYRVELKENDIYVLKS